MSLTERQCKHLRGLGHALKPLVVVGSAGLSASVLAEVNSTLDHHELIKVRIRANDRKDRDTIITELTAKTTAKLVQRVGNIALIYRPAEKPKIVLPKKGSPPAK